MRFFRKCSMFRQRNPLKDTLVTLHQSSIQILVTKMFKTRAKTPTKTVTEPPNFTEKLFRLRNQIVFLYFIQFNFIHVDFNHFTIT